VQADGNCFEQREQGLTFCYSVPQFTDKTYPELGDLHDDL